MNNRAHSDSVVAYIALGANLGNPLQQLDTAVLAIGAHEKITRLCLSKIYCSKPHGDVAQNNFLNAVLKISTTLSPEALLAATQKIEIQLGRDRSENAIHWGPRMIDLDIILYDDVVMNNDTLTIPHPLAHEREFVIQPLVDLSETLVIPGHGAVQDLAKQLPIQSMEVIRDVTTFNY